MHRFKKALNARTIALGAIVTVLLTSGVSYAANEWTGDNIVNGSLTNVDLAPNTITSGRILDETITNVDIKDGSVKAPEIASNSIGTGRIVDGAVQSVDVLDGTLTGTDVQDGSIDGADVSQLDGDADIIDNTITTFDIATNAIDSDEVLDFGLSNEDVGVLFAQVNADGSIANSSGGVTSFSLGTGTYEVDFGRDISSCGFTGTQGEAGVGGAGGAIIGVTDRSGNAEAIFVTTRDAAGSLVNTAVQLMVVC